MQTRSYPGLRASRLPSFLPVLLAWLTTGFGCQPAVEAPPAAAAPTIAIPAFQATGGAESGQHALELLTFADAVASQFGATSDWIVLESSRTDMLTEEMQGNAPPAPVPAAAPGAEPPAEAAATWASSFPEADYVLLGQINGFDVAPARDGSGTTLSRRTNRIRTTLHVRIVEVRTRRWLASRTVFVDEALPDDGRAETQINHAMQMAADRVVSAVLLAAAGEFSVEAIAQGGDELLTISGGSRQGVRPGLAFPVTSQDPGRPAATIEIVEARPDSSLARVMDGRPAVGDRVQAEPRAPDSAAPQAPLRLAFGGFYQPGSDDNAYVGGPLFAQIASHLKVQFQDYGGIEVVEDRDGVVQSAVTQQFLDDLNKGREPGLPMGSLRGADYLIFGTVSHVGLSEAHRTSVEMFGTRVQRTEAARGQLDGTIYLIDVNSGAYVAARPVSVETELPEDTPTERAISVLSQAFGQRLFAALALDIRPLTVLARARDEVVLNHKRAVGLAVGDRFQAMTPGQSVVDQYTGAALENVGGSAIGELEITGFDAAGWARARLVSGDLPQAGDRLVTIERQNATERQPARKLNW